MPVDIKVSGPRGLEQWELYCPVQSEWLESNVAKKKHSRREIKLWCSPQDAEVIISSVWCPLDSLREKFGFHHGDTNVRRQFHSLFSLTAKLPSEVCHKIYGTHCSTNIAEPY